MELTEVEKRLSEEHDTLVKICCGVSGCDGVRFYYTEEIEVDNPVYAKYAFDINGRQCAVAEIMPVCNVCGVDMRPSTRDAVYIKGGCDA